MKFFHVMPADWEPKRHSLVAVAGVHRYKRVLSVEVSREKENAPGKVSIPMVEEKI